MSPDNDKTDVTHNRRPIVVAACHDVINEHLALSWQRSPTSRDVTAGSCEDTECVSRVDSRCAAVKVEETDSEHASGMSTDIVPCRLQSPAAAAADNDDDDDDETEPLDLTTRRRESCDSLSASSAADAGHRTSSDMTAAQLLLLNGQRYEIVPVGDGRWLSRGELDQLSTALQNGQRCHAADDDTTAVTLDDHKHRTTPAADRPARAHSNGLDDVITTPVLRVKRSV